jgi:Tat protein translocase TatB subunit
MSFFGLGGFEILLIGAIALFVLGPKRLLEAIREGRKVYRDLRRQRDTLQKMISEAIDVEELKKQIDVDGLKESAKTLENDLGLDDVAEEVRKAANTTGSVSRNPQSADPTAQVDPNIPSGANSDSSPKQNQAPDQEPQGESDTSTDPDEVRS